ncbi:hypothetical protein ABMA27_011435 [Loxostege sticticalis]|uniref:unspecific monooxygenase n=1 Tax=Loxostege sticticalis TaxID=481309 RepID=A0ABR3IGB7_LOXSC
MWLILLSICVVLVLWFLFRTVNRDYWKKRNVVQLNKDLFVKFLFGDQSLSEVYKDVYEAHPNEPYVGAFLNTKPALILRDLQNIQAVLVGDFESYHSRGIDFNDNDILADNILSISHYERWKTIRQKMTPLFTSSKLKSMTNVIEKSARDFVTMVKNKKEMREKPFIALYTYTTASIGASVFGIDTHTKDAMDSPFLEMSFKSVEPSFLGNLRVTISSLSPTLFKILRIKVFGDHEEFFIGAVKKALKARRNNPQPVNDFIGLCMELQKAGTMTDKSTGYEVEPTDLVLAAQAFFFFIAGTDTGANTMHFTLLELSSNPDVLKRLHEEIDKKFEETNEKNTYDDIDKLVYLDMVLNETMRKFPPVGLMQRVCTRDTVLPVGNLKVQKGVITVTPVFAIHRDEKLFPNPEKFDPERFAPSNAANLPKFGYMPFGEGKRICIGSRYARIQVKVGLAFLLRSFTLKPQNYQPKRFEKSVFSLRDPDAKYELILRENKD